MMAPHHRTSFHKYDLSLLGHWKDHSEKAAGRRMGAKVIDRMAKDLNNAFPEMSGFSPGNIKYMRKFAESWRNLLQFLQEAV